MQSKWFMSVALAAVVAATTACAGGTGSPEGTAGTGQATESAPPAGAAEAPTPDLEGIPEVVAVVNGTEISAEQFTSTYEGQFQQLAAQSQMSGEELNQDELKTQTVETMIGTELLLQEAKKRGIEATDKAIAAEVEKLVASNQLKSKEELFASLAKQGLDEKTVNVELEKQVRLNALIEEESGDLKPTEEELKAAYEQAKAQQAQLGSAGGEAGKVPSFEEMRPGLEEQLVSQKQGEAAQTLVDSLRKSADVKVNL